MPSLWWSSDRLEEGGRKIFASKQFEQSGRTESPLYMLPDTWNGCRSLRIKSVPHSGQSDFIRKLPHVHANGSSGFVLDDSRRWMNISLEVANEEGDSVGCFPYVVQQQQNPALPQEMAELKRDLLKGGNR